MLFRSTTNEAEYWQDATGARRLVSMVAGEIRLELIRENRLQWFAEARAQYEAGATWWEFPPAIEAAREARQQVDPWEDLLRDAIAHGRKIGNDDMGRVPWPDGSITSADIMRDWLRLDAHQQGQTSSTRLGRVMRRLGFAPVRIGHDRDRGWQRADTPTHAATQVSA